jgi:hypothetical protein
VKVLPILDCIGDSGFVFLSQGWGPLLRGGSAQEDLL